jgi:hypothetical protein
MRQRSRSGAVGDARPPGRGGVVGAGRMTSISRPPPGRARPVSAAPWASAIARTIARPSPCPSLRWTRSWPSRWNGWKSRATAAGGITAPVAGLAFLAGLLAVPGCLLAGRLLLPAAGFDSAHGYALVSISQGQTPRAAGGSVLYLVLIALLRLGVATAVRDTAASIGVVLALLYLPPILAQTVSDPLRRPPAPGRSVERRPRRPVDHQPPRPADRPVGRARGARRVGGRGAACRCATARTPRHVRRAPCRSHAPSRRAVRPTVAPAPHHAISGGSRLSACAPAPSAALGSADGWAGSARGR